MLVRGGRDILVSVEVCGGQVFVVIVDWATRAREVAENGTFSDVRCPMGRVGDLRWGLVAVDWGF